MYFSEWEPVYVKILNDMGIDRSSDETSARSLKLLTINSDIISEDDISGIIKNEVIVAGGNVSSDDMILLKELRPGRTLISAGSAADVLMMNDIVPDIAVTDLDGDAELQKKASASGSVLVVHAHGDNLHLIKEHVKDIKTPIMITTQSRPDITLCNFGGFTDGDRAVCMARHFGAKKITLIGFKFDEPAYKPDTDMVMKKRKLRWAERIIFEMNPDDVEIIQL